MMKRQSLAFGVPPSSPPRTIHALALSSEASFPPKDDRTMLFGRNKPEVHVCVGERDPEVSRQHGKAVFRDGRWWLTNTGKRPIRLAAMRYLFPGDEEFPLPDGYTPLFVVGSATPERPLERREHLLEMYVTGPDGAQPPARHAEATRPPRTWRLEPDERLALLILSQEYLYYHFHPQPMSYQKTAEQLAALQPEVGWTKKKVEWLVKGVRDRLSGSGVHGLTKSDICGVQHLTKEDAAVSIGNMLNENLIKELMLSTTLVPRDLALLDADLYVRGVSREIPPVRGRGVHGDVFVTVVADAVRGNEDQEGMVVEFGGVGGPEPAGADERSRAFRAGVDLGVDAAVGAGLVGTVEDVAQVVAELVGVVDGEAA